MLVLVEGESDAAAVRVLAERIGCDVAFHQIEIRSADGVSNFPRLLTDFVKSHPGAAFCGMYDIAEERHVRRALGDAGIVIAVDEPPASLGFFACVSDLEDELITALGVEKVERLLETQGELHSFRRFQAMPQHRQHAVGAQLHRFLGTRATRKIRSARRLVEALDLARLPRPLAQLAERFREVMAAR
jgi:GNAT superfamily N-acetyltransferase